MGPSLETTNDALALLIGEVKGSLSGIHSTLANLDRTINGNGKPGLIEDHRCLQLIVKEHLRKTEEEKKARELLACQADEAKKLLAVESKEAVVKLAKEVNERKEKWSARTWALFLLVLGAFVSQAGGLVVLFIRTGGIK